MYSPISWVLLLNRTLLREQSVPEWWKLTFWFSCFPDRQSPAEGKMKATNDLTTKEKQN